MELVSKISRHWRSPSSPCSSWPGGRSCIPAFHLLIKPILRTFEERENLSVKPIEESRRLLSEADEKAKGYEEALRKGAAEALARKRGVMEETSRAGRREIEAVVEETNQNVEKLKAGSPPRKNRPPRSCAPRCRSSPRRSPGKSRRPVA